MKYIVDLPDAYTSESALFGDILSIPICLEGGKRYGIPTGIKLEPYTELDREAIEDEVWEFARKIECMGIREMEETFNSHYPFNQMSYKEAKVKYDAWKKKKDKIQIGDEVIYNSRTRAVVFEPETEERYGIILTSDFARISVSHNDLEKTGRHFDEIEELVKKMKDTDGN